MKLSLLLVLFLLSAPFLPAQDNAAANLALDTEGAPLSFTGSADFTTVSGAAAHDGVDALRAASFPGGYTERVLSFTVTGPARVRVWRKMVDPDGWGNFVMKLDGFSIFSTSAFGNAEWAQVMLPVPRGTHTVGLAAIDYGHGTNTEPQITLDQLTVTPEVVPLSEFITSPPTGGFRQPYGSPIFMSVQTMANSAFTFQWRKDGTDLPGRTMPNLEIFNFQAADAGYYTVRVSDGVDDWESLPILQAPFVSSDPWFTQTSVDRDGGGAWQSGVTPHWGENQRNESFNGVGTLRFWWKVSSESGKDFLRFNWNGQVTSISGEQDWAMVERVVNHGDPLFNFAVWTYSKDGAGTAGGDAAWVDSIEFIPGNAAPQISSAPPSGNVPYGLWTHQVAVTDADDTAFAFSLLNAPSGMSISSSGLITWNTTDAGTSSGTVTIRAADGGENNAPAATQTFSVAVVPRSVTWTITNASHVYDGTAKSVSVISSPPGVSAAITYDGSPAAPADAGSYAVVVSSSDANYTGNSNDTLVIAKATQTINFNALPDRIIGSAPFPHGATADSGLAVTVTTSNAAVATVSGGTVTVVGLGSVTLTATQAGGTNHLAAAPVARSFSVVPAGLGTFQLQNTLVSPYTHLLNARTGGGLAVRGDLAVVADLPEAGFSAGTSRVHVYTRTAGVWSLTQTLPRPPGAYVNEFGQSLAIREDGSELIVGVSGWARDRTNPVVGDNHQWYGGLTVWRKDGLGVWQRVQDVFPRDFQRNPTAVNGNGVGFGCQMSLSGDTCAISRLTHDAVYLFNRTPEGRWVEQVMLEPPNPQHVQRFGHAVALNGDTLAISAPGNMAGFYSQDQAGAVYVYQRQADRSWVLGSTLTQPNGVPRSYTEGFGALLALDEGRLVVSDPYVADRGQAFDGAAYVYERDGNGQWQRVNEIRAAFPVASHAFFGGYAMQLAGSRLAISHKRSLEDLEYGPYDGAVTEVFQRDANGAWLRTHVRQQAPGALPVQAPATTWNSNHLIQSHHNGFELAFDGRTLLSAYTEGRVVPLFNGEPDYPNASAANGGAFAYTLNGDPAPNAAPDAISLSGTHRYPIMPLADELIGTLTAADSDHTSGFAFTLAAGAGDRGNVLFTIANGHELRVANAAALAQESAISIRLRVTDPLGAGFEQSFTLLQDTPLADWLAAQEAPLEGWRADGVFNADADPDHDGVPNLLEFLADSDPSDDSARLAQTLLKTSIMGETGSFLGLEFDVDATNATLVELIGEWSDDLIAWHPIIRPVQIVSEGGGRRVIRVLDDSPVGSGRRFLRLRVEW